MPYDLRISEHSTIANSATHAILAGNSDFREEDIAITADVGLRITAREGKGFGFVLFRNDFRSEYGFEEEGISDRSSEDIFAIIENCRRQWVKSVVDFKGKLFQERWDFKPTNEEPEDILEQIMPPLALAGEKLFRLVFERQCEKPRAFGPTLRSALTAKPSNIGITSGSFFLPWGMIYTHPVAGQELCSNGSNWKKEGFWGYQHTIWHNTEKVTLETKIRPSLSINFHQGLSTALKLPIIDQHFEEIAALVGDSIQRTRKSELKEAFTNGRSSLERIIYFYCHGHGGTNAGSINLREAQLSMTDEPVSAYDFQDWSGDDEKLPTSPLVFINACQGGHMTTIFYHTLAAELLKQGAVGLVGAQIDIPAVFAVEYGRRILARFLSREEGQSRLGPIMRDVTRSLLDEHRNPLGLVYSLYRGANCFIDWRGT